MNSEEENCAIQLEQIAELDCWVRNIDQRSEEEGTFWLQTSTDKFYPDFVARLKDGRFLVVEYKGEHLWGNPDSEEKKDLGEFWADRSKGKCLFVMTKGKDFSAITDAVRGKRT